MQQNFAGLTSSSLNSTPSEEYPSMMVKNITEERDAPMPLLLNAEDPDFLHLDCNGVLVKNKFRPPNRRQLVLLELKLMGPVYMIHWPPNLCIMRLMSVFGHLVLHPMPATTNSPQL